MLRNDYKEPTLVKGNISAVEDGIEPFAICWGCIRDDVSISHSAKCS